MFGNRYFGGRYFGGRYFGKVGLDIVLICDDISRDIAADTATEIAIDFTRPVYLVKMDFTAGTQYVSSGPQILFDSNNYIEGQVRVRTFTWTGDGTQTGSIQLLNENFAASALFLNNEVNDTPISIYLTYLIVGGGNTTPELLVTGSMNGGGLDASKLTIAVVSTKSSAQFVPNRYYTMAEGFNHMPVDGSTITWGGEKFILEADRG